MHIRGEATGFEQEGTNVLRSPEFEDGRVISYKKPNYWLTVELDGEPADVRHYVSVVSWLQKAINKHLDKEWDEFDNIVVTLKKKES